jgi:periplasmic protein TonB
VFRTDAIKKHMAAYVHDTQFFTRRTVVLFAIIGLHVFIFWALATGLAQKAIEVLAPPIQTEIVQEEVKKVDLPPPPPPEFQKPPVEVPPTDVVVDMPVESNTTAISNVTSKPQAAAPPPRAAVAGTPVRAVKLPNTEDYYPSASQRLGEEGTTTVHVCVDPTGKIASAPTVSQSSGKPRLDEGAVSLAKAGKYAPATAEGKPEAGCVDFRVKFQLH